MIWVWATNRALQRDSFNRCKCPINPNNSATAGWVSSRHHSKTEDITTRRVNEDAEVIQVMGTIVNFGNTESMEVIEDLPMVATGTTHPSIPSPRRFKKRRRNVIGVRRRDTPYAAAYRIAMTTVSLKGVDPAMTEDTITETLNALSSTRKIPIFTSSSHRGTIVRLLSRKPMFERLQSFTRVLSVPGPQHSLSK